MNVRAVAPGEVGVDVDYSSWLGCDTMAKLFRHQCKRYGNRTAHREKDLGIWNAFSWNDYYDHVKWIALALIKRSVPADVPLVVDGIDAAQELIVDPEVGLHVRARLG